MNIAEHAKYCGFTEVETAAGWLDVDCFAYRDALGYTFSESEQCFFSPERMATAYEIRAMESNGMTPLIYTRARDKFNLRKENNGV